MNKSRIIETLKHAFAIGDAPDFSEEDEELLARMAEFLVRRRLGEAAILTLETARPLNMMGAQVLAFLRPFISMVFKNTKDYNHFMDLLEDRRSIGRLISQIEDLIGDNPSQSELSSHE